VGVLFDEIHQERLIDVHVLVSPEATVAHPIYEEIDLYANADEREEHEDGVSSHLVDLIVNAFLI
jgi:hypothetical protein